MPEHSLVNCWLHLIWETKERFPFFTNPDKAEECKAILTEICKDCKVYLKDLYINPEHIHLLVSISSDITIKMLMQKLKGLSSHIINERGVFKGKFHWGRGYAAFSISSGKVEEVSRYIRNQKEHHRKKGFYEEWEQFFNEYSRRVDRNEE